MLTKNAVGNLINRYKAVLKKCNLLNTFGSLAVASMLVVGGAGIANANVVLDLNDGGTHTEAEITQTATDNFYKIHNGSTLNITGKLEFKGASTPFNWMYIGVNSSNSALTTGSGTVNVQGADGIYIQYGSVMVNSGTLTAKKIETGDLGNLNIGGREGVGVANIDGDAIFNAGNSYIARGEMTVHNMIIDGGSFRSGTSAASTLDVSGDVSISDGTFGARHGDADMQKLTATGGVVEVGQADGGISGGMIKVNAAASFSDGVDLIINHGFLDTSGAGSLTVADTAGDITLGNHGVLKTDIADFGTFVNNAFTDGGTAVKLIEASAGGTVLLTGGSGDISLNDYEALLKTVRDGIFDATTNQGVVAIDGYTNITDLDSLDDVGAQSGISLPTKTLAGGTLDAGAGVTLAGVSGASATVTGDGTYLTLTGNDGSNVVNTDSNLTVTEGASLNLGSMAHENKDFALNGTLAITNGGQVVLNQGTINANEKISLSGKNADDKLSSLDLTIDTVLNANKGLEIKEEASLSTQFGSEINITEGLTMSGASEIYINTSSTLTADSITIDGEDTRLNIERGSNLTADEITLTDQAFLSIDGDSTTNIGSLSFDETSKIGTSSTGFSVINIEEAFSIDPTKFVTGFSSQEGKFQLNANVTLNANELNLTAASADANTLSFGSSNQISGTSINVGTHGINIESGTLLAKGNVSGGAINLSGGDLILNSSANASLGTSVHLDDINSELTIDGGTWTATGSISIENGMLTINSGSLNASAGLTFGSLGSVTLEENSNLTADITDLGTVDLSATNKFTAMDFGNWTEDTTSNLTLDGSTVAKMSEEEYDAFIAEVNKDLESAGFGGTVDFTGFDISGVFSSLTDIDELTNSPAVSIGGGNLTFVGTTTFAGISDTVSSTISGAGVSLVLTGLGNTDGVLSKGDITISDSGELILGYKDDTGTSPANTTFAGNINVSDANSSLIISNTSVVMATDKGISLSGGADIDVVDASISLDNLNISNSGELTFVSVGEGARTEGETPLYGTVKVTGSDGIEVSGTAMIMVYYGNITAEKIVFKDATSGAPQLTIGYKGNLSEDDSVVTLTGADGLSLGARADLNMTQGTLNTKKLTFSDTSQVNIGMTSDTRTSIVNFTANQEFAVSDFVNAKTDNKIAVGTTGVVNVDGTLALTGGGDLAIVDGGIISAKALTLDNTTATMLKGGNIHLMAGSGNQALSGALTVDNVNSNLEVKGGTWVADDAITINNGNLVISSGTLDVSGATFTAGNNAVLKSAKDSTLIVDNASIGIGDDGKVSGSATVSGADVTGLLGTVVIGGFNNITLAYGNSTTDYGKLVIAGQTTFGTDAIIDFDGVTVDTSNATLADVAENNDNSLGTYTVKGGTIASNQATVGSIAESATNAGGELTITGQADDNKGVLAKGDINTEGGTTNLGTAGQESNIGGALKGSGGTTNTSGGVTVENTELSGSAKLIIQNGKLITTNLKAVAGNDIVLGDGENKADLETVEADLDGANMTLDPAWKGNDEIVNASSGAIAGFAGSGAVDGKLTAGRNSYIVLGEANTAWAQASFADSGLVWGQNDISAALFIKNAQVLDSTNGAILVDGTVVNGTGSYLGKPVHTDAGGNETLVNLTANSAIFTKDSLLVVDASGIGDQYALTAGTIETVGNTSGQTDGAKLLITNVKLVNGEATINIAKASSSTDLDIAIGSWGNADDQGGVDKDSIVLESGFLAGNIIIGTDGSYSVKVGTNVEAFPRMDRSLAALTTRAFSEGTQAVQEFVTNTTANNDDGSTLEGAAKFGVASASMSNAAAIANLGSQNAGNRTSFVGSGSSTAMGSQSGVMSFNGEEMLLVAATDLYGLGGGKNKMMNGFGMWVQPMYQHTSADGFQSGNYEYGFDTDFYGVSVGGDYTFDNVFRLGIAAHMGTGDSESSGDFNKTDNDFAYYGFSLYGGYLMGNILLSADLGYSQTNNEVNQDQIGGTLESDFDASTISAGIKAEYKFELDNNLNLVPHIAARINHTKVDSFDSKQNNSTIFRNEESDATTFAIPIGISLSKEIETANGMKVVPSIDAGVQFAFGDLDVDQEVRMAGVSGSSTMESEIFDPVTFKGGLGVDLVHKNLTFGINYDIDASSNLVNQRVMGTVRFEF